MRILILIFITILTLNIEAQEFKYHALQSSGITVKSKGSLKISDSTFTINTSTNGKIESASYDITNTKNNLTYISDGMSTHHYVMKKETGKVKGKKYNTILYLTMNLQPNPILILYYFTAED